jgi:hypothetical protein
VIDYIREDHHWQPIAHHIFWCVIAALDYDVRLDSLDESKRGVFVKDQNLVYAA